MCVVDLLCAVNGGIKLAKEETKMVTELTDKFYEEMRKIEPNFRTTDREAMLITSAITLAVRDRLNL